LVVVDFVDVVRMRVHASIVRAPRDTRITQSGG
jgi:hypothetical protein